MSEARPTSMDLPQEEHEFQFNPSAPVGANETERLFERIAGQKSEVSVAATRRKRQA